MTYALALITLLLIIALAAVYLRHRAARIPAADQPLAGVIPVPGEPARGPPLPVVLVHGLFGFDRIGTLHYFRGIARHLESLGCHAHAVRLPRVASVPARAAKLVELIDKLGHPRVDLICHSLGGLDARYALSKLGLAARVRALVTIGTPHHGTPIADLLALRPLARARATLARLGLPIEALDWLTTWRLRALNAELADVAGVRYASVVTATDDRARVHPLLRATHLYLARAHGASDGLVPRASQIWGEVIAEAEIDHWAQIGWSGDHDAGELLVRALARLDALPPGARPRELAAAS